MQAVKMVIAILILVIFYSCNSYSLRKDMLQSNALNALNYPKVHDNQIIFFKKTLIYTDDNRLLIKRHRILKLGNDLKSAPEVLYTYDRSLEKLLNCEARVLRRNKKVAYYKLKDFHTINLSNARMISDAKIRLIPVADVLLEGDIVEIISQHEQTFPELGSILSPAEAGTHVYNSEFVIEYPVNDSIYFKITDPKLKPIYSHNEDCKRILFRLKTHNKLSDENYFNYKNKETAIYINKQINAGNNDKPSWTEFGNWYLQLINQRLQATPEICDLAEMLTKNLHSDKAKMDTIFQYIQKNIRYEQEYLEYGGIIPNPPAMILSRKYGDCKDYSLIMYLMAECVGLNTDLTLCYRGRGIQFYDDLPVSQFNHMILHLNYDGTDYWYDGTNRTGISGITTADLINQKGLVIKKDNSRLINIAESGENKIYISGHLLKQSNNLNADLRIVLSSQYAIDFFYVSDYLNSADFSNYLIDWVHNTLGSNLTILDLLWEKNAGDFTIFLKTEIPNSIIRIDSNSFVSLKKIFNCLLPDQTIAARDEKNINYYPDYGRINIELQFPEFLPAEAALGEDIFKIDFNINLPPGPFDSAAKIPFIERYNKILEDYARIYKLRIRG
ncbi:MAG: DUF3857 domain-containing protein [Calditrichaceae bacterium]|nr:DUF3857 domain-containing protein [Calditrichaceae bacterium]